MDKEKLERKKKMQEARNIIKTLSGITVIQIFEPGEGDISRMDLCNMGVIGGFKEADEVIDPDVSDQWICDFLRSRTGLAENDVIFLLLPNGIWVKVRVDDVDLLVKSFLNTEYRGYRVNQFSFVDSDLSIMYEICSDSRDEDHILYDEYKVIFQ